jgi:MFS family permease
VLSLLMYFTAFNMLEASLPSLISKMAPAAYKGTAIGVHNTAQSFGVFLGAVVGGYLSSHYGFSAVFIFCAILMGVWLLLAFGMKTPPSVKTKMYHVELLTEQQAKSLTSKIAQMAGVQEVVAIAKENTLMVKINNQQSLEMQTAIEQNILELIGSK